MLLHVDGQVGRLAGRLGGMEHPHSPLFDGHVRRHDANRRIDDLNVDAVFLGEERRHLFLDRLPSLEPFAGRADPLARFAPMRGHGLGVAAVIGGDIRVDRRADRRAVRVRRRPCLKVEGRGEGWTENWAVAPPSSAASSGMVQTTIANRRDWPPSGHKEGGFCDSHEMVPFVDARGDARLDDCRAADCQATASRGFRRCCWKSLLRDYAASLPDIEANMPGSTRKRIPATTENPVDRLYSIRREGKRFSELGRRGGAAAQRACPAGEAVRWTVRCDRLSTARAATKHHRIVLTPDLLPTKEDVSRTGSITNASLEAVRRATWPTPPAARVPVGLRAFPRVAPRFALGANSDGELELLTAEALNMLSPETLEQYRRMTIPERLKLALRMMEEGIRCLNQGDPKLVKRRLESCAAKMTSATETCSPPSPARESSHEGFSP